MTLLRLLLRRSALCALALSSSACQPRFSPFSERQIGMGQEAATRVRAGLLLGYVQAIYEARLTDLEPAFTYTELCPEAGCAYNRAATAELIRQVWSGLDPRLRYHERRIDNAGLVTTNLLLDIPSAVPSADWVLAVAHYDAWFGGANDNATGVAVTLEAAFALSELELERNVRLLLTDGEELGLVGAERYLAEHGSEGLVMVLNADMLAHRGAPGSLLTREASGTEYIVQGNEVSREEAFQLADLGRRLPEPVELRPVVFPDDGVSTVGFAVGSVLSDHGPFWLRGVPALFPFPAGDKPDWYHTPDDTPDQVDSDRLVRMGKLWSAAIAAFATRDR
jgi:peptidase M28-like protein